MPYYYSFTSLATATVVRDVFVLHILLTPIVDVVVIVVVVNEDDIISCCIPHFGISCY